MLAAAGVKPQACLETKDNPAEQKRIEQVNIIWAEGAIFTWISRVERHLLCVTRSLE